jgi:(2Fe-2S) ferredoxin
VLNVQPDDVWYGHVDPSAAAEIVSRHLVDGHPVQSRRLARSKGSDTC